MATDFLTFIEGENRVLTSGMPGTCYFLLSTKNVAAFLATDTLAGGVAEITGTGYGRTNQALPTPVGGDINFAASTWSTGSATNWPSSVCSIVLVTSSDNSGKAICAWNLVPGGAGRNLASASLTEVVTPTLTTESVDMSFASTVASLRANATALTNLTATIVPMTHLIDEGSNVVNNGTFDIYQVPSTGIYQVDVTMSAGFNTSGSTTTNQWSFGLSVNSTSAGGTTPTGYGSYTENFEYDIVGGENHVRSFITYLSLTAGQFINIYTEIASTAQLEILNSTEMGIQRIA